MTESTRRSLLAGIAVGVGAALAGCAEAGDSANDDDGPRRVTVVASIDEDELESRQDALEAEFDAGNVTASEYQIELVEIETELRNEAVETVESLAEDAGITVEDTLPDQGLLLVEGDDTKLLELLEEDAVASLAKASFFDEAADTDGAGNETTDTDGAGNETTEPSEQSDG